MAHKKLELSRDFTKAQTRIASLQGIDAKLDLGNGLSLDSYRGIYQQLLEAVTTYNAKLTELVDQRDVCRMLLAELRSWNNRMKAGVAAKFGTDSVEYEQAGGVRKAGRRHKGKDKPAA